MHSLISRSRFTTGLRVAVLALTASTPLVAQVTVPPSGDNQAAEVKQWIGPVELGVTYHSPDITSPTGEDRRGKVWGQLVPYGYANLGFGTCGDKCPWRGGANENTVFKTSHDITVEGKPLPAGAYGLHFLPGKDQWTVIFSKNSTSWGSFFYDEAEDALRVNVTPHAHPYTHWLSYEFLDRETDHATLELQWEELAVPIKLAVPEINQVYVAALRRELRSSPGFTNASWVAAAQFALNAKVDLPEAQGWAEKAVSDPFVGEETFTTLMLLADLQEANGKDSAATRQKALDNPTATPIGIHTYARGLQARGKVDEAVKIFQFNAKRFPNRWPVQVGLMRAYSAQGKFKEAAAAAKVALAQAPDDGNKQNLTRLIARLEKGEDINK